MKRKALYTWKDSEEHMMIDGNDNLVTLELLKDLSAQDFLMFGVQDVAYVREVQVEGKQAFSIHAANGQPLSVVDSQADAIHVIEHNGFEETPLH